jgi:hypothetical protein
MRKDSPKTEMRGMREMREIGETTAVERMM